MVPKFHKQEFYNKTENKMKVFSYTIAVPKEIVEQAKLQGIELICRAESNKIIIEKKLDK